MRETTRRFGWFAMAVTVLGVCLALLLTGCASQTQPQNSSNSDKAAPPENTLIVGLDNAFPPYGYVGDDKELTGFDIDLAKEVAKRNGWEIQLEAIDWDSKDALLESGAINCIWNGFTIEGREDDYTFSEPYMLNEQVVVVRADSGINGVADLADKTVVTQKESSGENVLKGDMADVAATFAGGEPVLVDNYDNAFVQLESGAADAVVCDVCIAYNHMIDKTIFKQLDESLSGEHFGVGFALGQEDLAAVVSDTLFEMYEDGTIKSLCEKYADQGIEFENWVLTRSAADAADADKKVDNAEAPAQTTQDEVIEDAEAVQTGNADATA